MAFNTKTDFSRQIIQHENTTAILSGNTSVLGDFYIKSIELTPQDITIGETLVYDGVRLKPGSTTNYQDRVIVGMGLNVDSINALKYNVSLGQYTIGNNQYYYSGGTVTITDGDPSLSRFDIVYITSSNTPSVLMGTSSPSPITPTLSSGQLSLGIILVPAGYFSGSTGTTIFSLPSSDTIFRYHNGYTSAIERSDGNSEALANFAMALSRDSRVTGQDGVSLGLGTKANTNHQTSLGKYNEFDTDALLIVGYGQDDLNRSNAMSIDFSGNTKIHQNFFINDIQIDLGVPNTGDVLRYNGIKFAPETLVWNIELPYNVFSGLTSYTSNATYKITGVHPELYGGTDIFIKTDDFGNLDTNRATGKFYNPKYDQNVVGFGIWDKYDKWDFNSIIGTFNNTEIVTSNNGATGQLYQGIYSGLFTKLTGDWSTSTAITGNTTNSKANITNVSIVNYTAGTKTIWGGYVWENLTGGTGNNIDILNLNTNDWVKIPYSSTSDYNITYDEIGFDINNNWIDRRYETGSENEVSETKLDYIFFGFTYPSISVFMWGNKYNSTLDVGLKLNKVKNSYFESVDFRGATSFSNELKNNSYISDNVIIGEYVTINNNILNSTNSSISDNFLLGINSAIYKNKLEGISNRISDNTINYNSKIHDNYINSSNGYISYNILYDTSVIRDNILNGSNSILQNNALYNNSEIKENELNGNVYISDNIINNSFIRTNKLIGDNLGISYNSIKNTSYIQSNYINGAALYIQMNNITGGTIANNHISGYQNEIRENTLKNNNNAIQYNSINNNDNFIRENVFNSTYCAIENNTFTSESEIWGNVINGGNISNNNLIENCTISYNTKNSGDINYNILELNSSINFNGFSSHFINNKLTNNSDVAGCVFNASFDGNNLFNSQIQNINSFNYSITNTKFINYEYLVSSNTSYNNTFFIGNLPTSSTLDNIYIKKDNQLKEISLSDFSTLLSIDPAPIDGLFYAKKDGIWDKITIPIQLGLNWENYSTVYATYGSGYYNGYYYLSNNVSGNGILRSSDGKQWNTLSTPTGNTTLFYDVKGSNGTLIAIGNQWPSFPSNEYNVIRSTDNGDTWSYITGSTLETSGRSWRRITTNGKGVWIGCGFQGATTDNIIVSNDDGLTWVRKNLPISTNVTDIWYGNDNWYCTKYDGIGGCFKSSDNGENWTELTVLSSNTNTIAGMFANGVLYLVSQNSGSNSVAVSFDEGTTFIQGNTSLLSGANLAIAYGNGVAVITNNSGRYQFSLDNGLNWYNSNVVSGSGALSICYGNGVFVSTNSSSGNAHISGSLIDSLLPLSNANNNTSSSISGLTFDTITTALGYTPLSSMTLTGDINGSGFNSVVTTLASITTGNTVGSSTQIPIISYDDKGRITSATTISISIPTQGITNINNQTGTTQTLITGNTGNDFNIVSSGNTHIFNIPTASSSTTRGLLSSSDFNTFNNKQTILTDINFGNFSTALSGKTTPIDADTINISDSADSNKAKKVTWLNVWTNYILPKIQAVTTTIAGLWTFADGITISGGRITFTNITTPSGDSWYRQAVNVIRGAINGTDRIELNTTGVRTLGTHTFTNTIFTNLAPTTQSIAAVQTTGELTANFVATTFYQLVHRFLTTVSNTTTESIILNPNLGAVLIPSSQMFIGSKWLYTVPFALQTTGTVRFLVRFGEASTALTSRTILADTGAFTPALGSLTGGVLRVMFTVSALGASGVAVVICSIECTISGQSTRFSLPLRTTSGVSTLVDNLLEIDVIFGTASVNDTINVEHANSIKIS